MISVKTIFKVLVGTISIIVVFAFIVEFLNVHTSGQQLVALSKIAVRQACVLYAQETYKERQDWDSGATDINDIMVQDNNTVYISGDFYNTRNMSGTPQQIADQVYRNLHVNGTNGNEFREWITEHGDNWESIMLLGKKLMNQTASLTPDDKALADSYAEVLMTPLNTGVPYMDRLTLQHMARWHLTELLTNGDPDLIIAGDATNGGEDYVLYKGFKVYANKATVTITKDSYRVFDLTVDKDVRDFREITHINPEDLGYLNFNNKTELAQDERHNICILGVTYNVPISYEGVTFVKSMVAAVANNDVQGFDGSTQGRDRSNEYFDTEQRTNLTNTDRSNNDGFGAYTTDRLDEAAEVGSIAIPGKLIYYMVR